MTQRNDFNFAIIHFQHVDSNIPYSKRFRILSLYISTNTFRSSLQFVFCHLRIYEERWSWQ